MTVSRTSGFRRSWHDHFEPAADLDPLVAKRMRGYLDQIDYTTYASNQAVIGQALGQTDAGKFQRLAVAAAQARTLWVASAMTMTQAGAPLGAEQVAELARLRTAFEELSEVYEAMRRMVERGYLGYRAPAE